MLRTPDLLHGGMAVSSPSGPPMACGGGSCSTRNGGAMGWGVCLVGSPPPPPLASFSGVAYRRRVALASGPPFLRWPGGRGLRPGAALHIVPAAWLMSAAWGPWPLWTTLLPPTPTAQASRPSQPCSSPGAASAYASRAGASPLPHGGELVAPPRGRRTSSTPHPLQSSPYTPSPHWQVPASSED